MAMAVSFHNLKPPSFSKPPQRWGITNVALWSKSSSLRTQPTSSQLPLIRLSCHATEPGHGGKLTFSPLSFGVNGMAKKIGKFHCEWGKDGFKSTTASDEAGDQDAQTTQSESKSRGLAKASVAKWVQDNMGDVIQFIKVQCRRAKGGSATETGDGDQDAETPQIESGSRGLPKAYLDAKLWLHMHINYMGHQLTKKRDDMLTLWDTSGLDAEFLFGIMKNFWLAILMARNPSWNQILYHFYKCILQPCLARMTKTKPFDDLEGVDAELGGSDAEFLFGIMKNFWLAILMERNPSWNQILYHFYKCILQPCLARMKVMDLLLAILMAWNPSWNQILYPFYRCIVQPCLARMTKTKPFDDLEGVDAELGGSDAEFLFGIMKNFWLAILMERNPSWNQILYHFCKCIVQPCLSRMTKTKPFDDLEGVDAELGGSDAEFLFGSVNNILLAILMPLAPRWFKNLHLSYVFIGEVVLLSGGDRKFMKLEIKLSMGFRLVGPQGTGKGSLVLAMAGVAFFSVSASDLALEVGTAGAALVGCEARKKAPSVIIIEAIGARTSNSQCGPALSKFLKEMDELIKHASVVFIAATNRHGTLDSDLMKSDKDKNFALCMKNIPMEENKAICYLVALRTQGLVGAARRGGDCVMRGDDVSKTYDDTKAHETFIWTNGTRIEGSAKSTNLYRMQASITGTCICWICLLQ